MDNGITEIYINTKIKDNSDASKLMRVFLENDAYDYEVCPVTSKRKYYLKNTDKGVDEMCAIMDEVRAEGRAEVIESLLRKGYTTQQISELLDIQIDEVREIENKLCAL